MPYIKRDRRIQLDGLVKNLSVQTLNRRKEPADGELNYILFALCKKYVKPSYKNYKSFIGELEECVTEIRRRILAPYEEEKIKESGDIE